MDTGTILNLYNFETSAAEGSRYVLTSPRSLEACSRLHIRPVELLPKPLADFTEENSGKSMEFIQILHNDWEEKRIEKLNRCRKSRENIIMEQKVVNNAQPRERSHQKNIDSNKMQKETKKALNKNLTVVSSFSTNRNLKNVESQKLTVADKGKTDTSAPVISTQSPSPVQVNDSVLHASAFQTVPDSITPHSDRSSRLKVSQLSGRSRSRSVELQNRHLRSEQSTVSLKSSFVFGHPSKLASGYITPQIQRDKRLVEVMKDRRRRDEDDGKLRQTKWMEWNTDLKRNNDIKKREEVRRQKELAESHRKWEKQVKEEMLKKKKEMELLEIELEKKQKQTESILKLNKEKQLKLRLQRIEDRKVAASERKHQQEKSLSCIKHEVMDFQQATEHDIKDRINRAERVKLENEIKELEKIRLMNKKQRERFNIIQEELKKKKEEDAGVKRETLNQKLSKAEENHQKMILERENALKLHGREINQKIKQTKTNQKKMDKKMEERLNDIAEHKKQLLLRASDVALKNTQNKSIRAQAMREESEKGWRRKQTEIQQRDEQCIQRTKENLEAKENRVKTHLQLKEAAFEFSRGQAKFNEAERDIIKRKSSNFSQMAQQAQLTASIGKGPRSSFVNYSTVKLG